MGKAAKREKAKRRRYFQRLAKRNPTRFSLEWDKRLSSWLFWINRNVGRLSDRNGDSVPAVFSVVDEAISILEACGKDIFKQYAKETFDLLSTQCCISFSKKAFPQFYRISNGKRLYERPSSQPQDTCE